MFTHPDYDGHEALLFAQDTASGLRALIAIHDTALGPAFGGCRMYPYASEQHAMSDVLRLSRGMTYKAAICELPYGGGKSVIIADPRATRRRRCCTRWVASSRASAVITSPPMTWAQRSRTW